MAFRRMTPVVVSSVPPTIPSTSAFRSAAGSAFTHAASDGSSWLSFPRAMKRSDDTRSAPSSIVMFGRCASAAWMCE